MLRGNFLVVSEAAKLLPSSCIVGDDCYERKIFSSKFCQNCVKIGKLDKIKCLHFTDFVQINMVCNRKMLQSYATEKETIYTNASCVPKIDATESHRIDVDATERMVRVLGELLRLKHRSEAVAIGGGRAAGEGIGAEQPFPGRQASMDKPKLMRCRQAGRGAEKSFSSLRRSSKATFERCRRLEMACYTRWLARSRLGGRS